jgi:hypothetical protein
MVLWQRDLKKANLNKRNVVWTAALVAIVMIARVEKLSAVAIAVDC